MPRASGGAETNANWVCFNYGDRLAVVPPNAEHLAAQVWTTSRSLSYSRERPRDLILTLAFDLRSEGHGAGL